MYSLMGAGTYGNSGMDPLVSFHMWKTFALQRMLLQLYGLEMSKLRQSDTMHLETLQRSVLHRLQCLPNNTGNVAVYCLLGVRPVEQEIDFRKFSLLISILYSENTIESELAKRQWQLRTVIVIAGSFTVTNCFINTISRKYTISNNTQIKKKR